jgi:uncharacterized repeat protein (TIGR01451 family)
MFWKKNTHKVTKLTKRERVAQFQKRLGVSLLGLAMFAGFALATYPAVSNLLNRNTAQAEGGTITPPCTSGCGTITPPCTGNCGTITPPPVTATVPVNTITPCVTGCGTITPPCSGDCGTITPPITPIVITVTPPVTPIVTPTPTPVLTPIVTPTPTPVITPVATPTPTPVITPVPTPTPVPANPAISLTKVCRTTSAVDGPICDKVRADTTVYYTLAVKNTGNVALANVFVEDNYNSSQLSWVGAVNGTGVIVQNAGYTRFGQFNLAINETRSINYAMKVASGLANGTEVVNTAVATGSYNGSDVVSNEAKARLTVEVIIPSGSPIVKIDHLCLPVAQNNSGSTAAYEAFKEDCGDFKPGDTIYYYVRVTNTGTAVARDLSVSQPLVTPANVGNCNLSFPQTRTTLDIGQNWDFRYTCVIKKDIDLVANTDVNSTATIVYGNPGLGNNTSDTAVFHIKQTVPERAIALKKFCVVANTTTECNDPKAGLKAGSIVTYTLRVTNAGKSDLTVLTLVDTYDAKISAVSDLVPAGKWEAVAGTVTWTDLGLFKSGGVKEYRFNAKLGDKVVAGSTVKNAAKVTAQDGLTATANYDFVIPTTTTTVAPPVQRTGAADVFLLSIFVLALGAGAYFFFNSGKVGVAFGGNKGSF